MNVAFRPALPQDFDYCERLYERLGFRTTHEDDRKFYMLREPDTDAPLLHRLGC
jgi:hypothetical protein